MDLGLTTTTLAASQSLYAGDLKRVERPVIVKSGQGALTRGTLVIAETTADASKYIKYNGTTPLGPSMQTTVAVIETVDSDAGSVLVPVIPANLRPTILAEDVDATSADVKSWGYATGEYSLAAVNTATGITLSAAAKRDLELQSIFFKTIA